jgi:hypothetical protein
MLAAHWIHRHSMLIIVARLFVALITLSSIACRTSTGQCGGQIPQHPTLNPFVIAYDSSKECVDLPLVDALILGAKGRNGRFAKSASEHELGVTALPGDVVYVSVYFDNGGPEEPASIAKNVRAVISVTPVVSNDHIISAKLEADNAATIRSAEKGGNIVIHTKSPTKLVYIPDTAILCIPRETALKQGLDSDEICGKSDVAVRLKNASLPEVLAIGDLEPGFKFSATADLKFKIIPVESGPK